MSDGDDPAITPIRTACEALAAAPGLQWEWDGRFAVALAAFDAGHEGAVRDLLDQHFGSAWSPVDLGGAPPGAQAVAKNLGGLRAGQQLWATDPTAGAWAYCAWWPWGSGQRFSIRIGYAADTEPADLETRFRGWFGV